MRRRSHRERRAAPTTARTLFQQLLAIHAGGWVFTAGLYSVDGVTGKVGAQIDHLNIAHVRSQSVEARQVALPAAHADFGGQLCQTFAGGQWYVDNGTAASWAFLSGGGGVELAGTLSPTSTAGNQMYLATNTSGTGPGLLWFQGAGTPSFGVRKSGGTVVVLQSPGALTTQPYIFQQRHATAEDPDASVKKTGSAAVTANYASAASADTPGGALTLGANPSGLFPMLARWHADMGVPRIISAAERAVRNQWLELTGIAA